MNKNYLIISLCILLLACSKGDKPSISFYLALERGDLNQIERHLAWGADPNKALPNRDFPLHIAVTEGRLAITRTLVRKGANPNQTDNQGKTPLLRALQKGRTQVAEFLIKQGAKFDANGLLHQIAKTGVNDRDVLRLLKQQKADFNSFDKQGETALTRAIKTNNLLLMKQLIRIGADSNQPNQNNESPLKLATQKKNQDMIRFLKRNGAALN